MSVCRLSDICLSPVEGWKLLVKEVLPQITSIETHDTWHVTFVCTGATIRTRGKIRCLPYVGSLILKTYRNNLFGQCFLRFHVISTVSITRLCYGNVVHILVSNLTFPFDVTFLVVSPGAAIHYPGQGHPWYIHTPHWAGRNWQGSPSPFSRTRVRSPLLEIAEKCQWVSFGGGGRIRQPAT